MSFLTTLKLMISGLKKPVQLIQINELPEGILLDIGGGGEGVIAQAAGARVFSVDKFLSEIQEALPNAQDAHWITADATFLPYKENHFDGATAFFSCMYMTNEMKEKVFTETRRVLKPAGQFWLWDVKMQAKSELYSVRLKAELPNQKKITTMYGVRAKDQSIASLSVLLQKTGFVIEKVDDGKHTFKITARKS